MTAKYPLHSQYVRLKNAEEAILTNIKSKSVPLIINDTLVSPINNDRADLPWSLGSKEHPWKNVFISNKSAQELSPSRSEVIDVYSKLQNAVMPADIDALKAELATIYSTKEETDIATQRVATLDKAGALKLASMVELDAYHPETVEVYVYAKEKPEHTLVKLDETVTSYKSWTIEPLLYTQKNTRYSGKNFETKKVKDAFPGVYKAEFDDTYVIVYKTTTICVENESKHSTTPRELAVYTKDAEQGAAYVNISTAGLYNTGLVAVDGISIIINDDGVISATGATSGSFCGNWGTWDLVPTTEEGFYAKGLVPPTYGSYLVIEADTSHSHTGETWRYKYTPVSAEESYNKDYWQPEYKIIIPAFTPEQEAALNSTITKEKVLQYDARILTGIQVVLGDE